MKPSKTGIPAALLYSTLALVTQAAFLDDIEVTPGEHVVWHPVKDSETHVLLQGLASDPDPTDRVHALQALRAIDDPGDTGLILALCQDPHVHVKTTAWETAAALKLDVPSTLLQEGLLDSDSSVRTAVYDAWSKLSTDAALQAISDGFREEDSRTRLAALLCGVSLWEDQRKIVEHLYQETDKRIQVRLFEALLASPKAPRQSLLDWGFTSNSPLLLAATLRNSLPKDAVAEGSLQNAMTNNHPLVREAAVESAIQRRDIGAITHSLQLLAMGDSSLRQIICFGARLLTSEVATPPLRGLLDTESDHLVRTAASQSLLEIHSPDALDALTAYINHADQRLRVIVIECMGQWSDKDVATRLFPVLGDSNADVLEATLIALLTLKNEDLSQHHKRLVELAKDRKSGGMAAEAIRALGWIGYRDIIPYVEAILKNIAWDDPYQKRRAGLEVLIQFDHTETLTRAYDIATLRVVPPPPGVPAGPQYDNDLTRTEAIRYIARFEDPERAPALFDKFEDIPYRNTRIMLMRFMKHFTGRDYELTPRHRHPNYKVENIGPGPYPSVEEPGIRPRS